MRWLVAAVVVAAVVVRRPKRLRRHSSSRNYVSRSGCLCRSATLEARRLQHSSSGSLRKRQCTCTRCFDHARADARAGARAGTRAGRASRQRADRRLLRNNTSRHLTLASRPSRSREPPSQAPSSLRLARTVVRAPTSVRGGLVAPGVKFSNRSRRESRDHHESRSRAAKFTQYDHPSTPSIRFWDEAPAPYGTKAGHTHLRGDAGVEASSSLKMSWSTHMQSLSLFEPTMESRFLRTAPSASFCCRARLRYE